MPQGFAASRPRPEPRLDHLQHVLGRAALLQIDSVNVLTRAHYLPAFSRIAAYPRTLLEALPLDAGRPGGQRGRC